MKPLNKEFFFKILPKINALLVLSVIALTIYLLLNILRPYQPSFLNKGCLIKSPEDEINYISRRLENLPVFQEVIFNERPLFNTLVEKEPRQEATTLELLGLVSVGDKFAAMIRDTKDNKDYYCLGGEVIGEFMVKQILKDRVILESEKGRLELSP